MFCDHWRRRRQSPKSRRRERKRRRSWRGNYWEKEWKHNHEREGKRRSVPHRHSPRQLQTISTGNHCCDAAWNSSENVFLLEEKVRKLSGGERERERVVTPWEKIDGTTNTFSEALNNSSNSGRFEGPDLHSTWSTTRFSRLLFFDSTLSSHRQWPRSVVFHFPSAILPLYNQRTLD